MSSYLEAYGEHVGRFSVPREAARDFMDMMDAEDGE